MSLASAGPSAAAACKPRLPSPAPSSSTRLPASDGGPTALATAPLGLQRHRFDVSGCELL